MDAKKGLADLGLNKNDAAVYVALLGLGVTKAGPLIQKTRLHRMLVYNALDSLVAQGLATEVHRNNVKLFQAADPSALVERTKKISDLAHALVPDLRKLQQDKDLLVNVRTLIGPEGFQTNLENVIASAARQKNREMYILGGGKDLDFYNAVGDWYPTYVRLLEKNNIRKKLLAPSSFSSEFKRKFAAEKNTELKTVAEGLSSPTYTRITEEVVSIEMYEPQIVVIQIINKVIARAYMDSFELLWKTAQVES